MVNIGILIVIFVSDACFSFSSDLVVVDYLTATSVLHIIIMSFSSVYTRIWFVFIVSASTSTNSILTHTHHVSNCIDNKIYYGKPDAHG